MINIFIPVPLWVLFTFIGCIAGCFVGIFITKYKNRGEQIKQIKRIVELSLPKKGK